MNGLFAPITPLHTGHLYAVAHDGDLYAVFARSPESALQSLQRQIHHAARQAQAAILKAQRSAAWTAR